jgi:DNA-binding IscR family transcriptional regulator
MYKIKAVNKKSRATWPKIIAEAVGRTADPNSYTRESTKLMKRGYISSARGRKGGYWLTDKGRETAELIT